MKRTVDGPVVLVVLDGWGLRDEVENNGVALANTPWYDHLVSSYPFTQLHASGEAVGLPAGQMGNSEVGHTTIGAGYVLYQDLVRITKDATSGAFATNTAFKQAFAHTKEHKSTLHVLGILSAGGVHGHEDHLVAVVHAAKSAGVEKIVLHAFLDGRDSSKTGGVASLRQLEHLCESVGNCTIGSVMGRYYAMDRDTNWDRTDKAFTAIFNGVADYKYETTVNASQIIQEKYHNQEFDEHMEPIVFTNEDGKALEVQDNDALIFTNFRKDRARQLSSKICGITKDRNVCFVTMAKYGSDIEALVAFTPETIQATLGGAVAAAGLTQARIAETEKFPHATYFLNGGREQAFTGEEDVMIPSRKDIKTHDEAPEMKAKEICDAAIKRLINTDFIFINFANPDMVGHTANQKAIVTALEVVDRELHRLTDAVLAANGALLVIADHGNAEVMVDPITGEPHTAHTTNPVPCILVHKDLRPQLRRDDPGLSDVAPTILQLLGVKVPESMTGTSVLE